jgi:hypothetical protein
LHAILNKINNIEFIPPPKGTKSSRKPRGGRWRRF